MFPSDMKPTITRSAILIIASALIATFTMSCATARGFGKDVSHAGEHIEHSAR
jgi:predicted small secreted protein